MVGPIDVKQKGNALVGYWVQYVTLTFDLNHAHDLGCFKVKFRNSSISRIVGLIDVKWKGSELIWYIDLCDHGGVGVPDSDWGDFRCRRAVDKSSFSMAGTMLSFK